jgi:YD repeat-containing protein
MVKPSYFSIFVALSITVNADNEPCKSVVLNASGGANSSNYIFKNAQAACNIYGAAYKINENTFSCGSYQDPPEKWANCWSTRCKRGTVWKDGSCNKINIPQKEARTCHPIELDKGAKVFIETDYSYKSLSDVSVTRRYAYGENGEYTVEGSWKFGYTQKVIDNETVVSGKNIFEYAHPDGRNYYFQGDLSGSYPLLLYPSYQISPVKLEITEFGGPYRLIFGDGSVELFNSSGQLTKILSPEGYVKNVMYDRSSDLDGDSDNDLKITINDVVTGINIEYEHHDDSDAYIEKVNVVLPSPVGTSLTYDYEYVDGNLTGVTYPDSSYKVYKYDESDRLEGLEDEETSINSSNYITWDYQENTNFATMSRLGSEDTQYERLDIVYATDVNKIAYAQVTNSSSRVKTFYFTDIGTEGLRRLKQIDGNIAGSCTDSDSWYTYNISGLMETKTTGVEDDTSTVNDFGSTTRYVYHSTRRHLIIEENKGLTWSATDKPWTDYDNASSALSSFTINPESQKIVTAWHPDIDLPLSKKYYSRSSASAWNSTPFKTVTYTYDDQGFGRGSNDCTSDTTAQATYRVCSKTITGTGIPKPMVWEYLYTSPGANHNLTINGPISGSGDSIVYKYNSKGQLTEIDRPLGADTTFSSFNEYGFPENITDANGVIAELAYNNRGRLISIKEDKNGKSYSGGALTSLSYYKNGLTRKVTRPDSSWEYYYYDTARNLVGVLNNYGEYKKYSGHSAVNGEWSKLEVCTPGNTSEGGLPKSCSTIVATYERQLDELGRVSKILDAGSTEKQAFGYDRDGNRTTHVLRGESGGPSYDDSDIVMVSRFNERGFKTGERGWAICSSCLSSYNTVPWSSLSNAPETSYEYGAQGLVIKVTDANNIETMYEYTGIGNVLEELSADRGRVDYVYFDDGSLKSKKFQNGPAEKYIRDSLGRVTSSYYLHKRRGSPMGVQAAVVQRVMVEADRLITGRVSVD